MKGILVILLYLFYFGELFSQINLHSENFKDNSFEIGVAVGLSYEIQRFPNFRLSISGGIGKKIDYAEFLYPSLHIDLQLYNGGIGSSFLNSKRGDLSFDINTAVTLTSGIRTADYKNLFKRSNPLYYFNVASAKPLQNPYHNSFSFGSIFVISSDKGKKNQFVGFANLNFERTIQVSYYNDGTPFGRLLGDGYDRYHTGGGTVSYYGDRNLAFNFAEISYQRFTGYQRHAFEAANHIQLDFLPYLEAKEFYYNQTRWSFDIGNYDKGITLSILGYNSKNVQDVIHYIIDNTYHPDLKGISRWGMGIKYSYFNFTSK